ncbi:Cytochrome P450 monooxygenase lolP1 [Colletotrichum fructicola Nara gc5]|uniref:Cytochrome P450 monooxygenase lolP1 n=1 Tax=Colletotrichum fructicola (strain Nara gc5) TaxID=1213859 RepID=A0A7J6J8K7_COLFN|nr:Cytochrome P450 monooxygenase lolP1 [Colletotrichum fructicola Nara gc5]
MWHAEVHPVVLMWGLLLYAAALITRQYIRLRHIPGPPLAGFSPLWLLRAACSGNMHLKLYEASQKYGSLVRVGPRDVITSDPDFMKHMLGVRSKYTRSDWYDAMRLDPWHDNVLSSRDDAAHGKLRSQMAAGYSGKAVVNLEAKIDENVLRLMDLIDRYVSKDKPFDFGLKAQYFTLDVISDIAFGKPFGDLASNSDVHEYIHTTERKMPSIVVAAVIPSLLTVLSWPGLRRLLPSENDATGLGKLIRMAKEIAAERFGPNRTLQKDMLDSFVAQGLTQEEASSEILMQILAGSDTTATAIRATLLYLITNPPVLSTLRAEIERARPEGPVIKESEAREMTYLQAVIKEGLRIFPPVVGQMSKEVPRGGDTFKGVHLPEGTRVGYGAWGISRRAEVWGQDADQFRPDRWLKVNAEKLQLMEGTLEIVFGHGKWKCLGKNVAMMELQKVFVELLRRYDLVLCDPTRPWKSYNYGIFVQSEFWIKANNRKQT